MFMECKIKQYAKIALRFSEQILMANLHVNYASQLMFSGFGTKVQR